MRDIKNIVAKNITELRTSNNMTQIELGEKLNYSDKTISKWERAESSPDISVLVEIAELFGVTLDYLVKDENEEKTVIEQKTEKIRYNRRVISYIPEAGVWMASVLAFIITTLILRQMSFQWLYFVYTLPIVLILKLIFNSIWFNPRHNYFIVSALMWSILAAIHISFLYFRINVSLVYLLGIAGQIVIVLCSFIHKPKSNK
ncbi:MAG: helix-turn-helix transcriptional regulator [Ruminococcaceae bacterium]|nr:helix-turn-helix transcriptional regulator [Oscillospiraceae bacterium]